MPYIMFQGHYDEIKHHEHDVGARTSEARGDMSGRRNFHTDRHYHDADHHTDQQRDAKHKHGHGVINLCLKKKPLEKRKKLFTVKLCAWHVEVKISVFIRRL